MGSLILCHAKKARQPYEITRVHIKIYTFEELCYYIYHHLFLVDDTFVNHHLCDWLQYELEADLLADELRNMLNNNYPSEEFILRLLADSMIYSEEEICMVKDKLKHYAEQKVVEKEKFKADQLFKSGEIESAVFIYKRIVNDKWDTSIEPSFYGKTYACLGAAYGKMFLYNQSAAMYQKACEYLQDDDVKTAYVYTCYKAFPEEKYQEFLEDKQEYCEADKKIRQMIADAKQKVSIEEAEVQIPLWKNNYRGFNKI